MNFISVCNSGHEKFNTIYITKEECVKFLMSTIFI